MENEQYFALGVLTVLGLASIIAIVVGMFRVIRTEKKLRDLESCLANNVDSLSRAIDDLRENIRNLIDSVENSISERIDGVERTLEDEYDARIKADKWNLSQLDRVESKLFSKISVLDKIAKESPNYTKHSMDSLEKNIENLTKQ